MIVILPMLNRLVIIAKTAKANVTFTAKPVTQITAKVLSLCTSLDNGGIPM